MRAGSVPKQKGEKYYTVLKAKGEDQEARDILLIVLAKHDEVRRPYGQGFKKFAASEFSRSHGPIRLQGRQAPRGRDDARVRRRGVWGGGDAAGVQGGPR